MGMLEREKYPKVAITGVDGVGKSTSTWYALERLAKEDGLTIVKPNPPAEVITPDGRINQYVGLYSLVDRIHGFIDRYQNKTLVLLVNTFRVAVQGRIVEPRMINLYSPDVVVSTRDLIIDSAVYQVFYTPKELLRPAQQRINRAKMISGSPYRDLIVLLTVDPSEAVHRIERRIEEEKQKAPVTQRIHWVHLHENEAALQLLQAEYYGVLQLVRERHPTRIAEIDTNIYSREGVSGIIRNEILNFLSGNNQKEWVYYP